MIYIIFFEGSEDFARKLPLCLYYYYMLFFTRLILNSTFF